MSSYIDNNLVRNETVLYRSKLSLLTMAGPIGLGLLLIPFYGIGLLIILACYINFITTELAVTNKRVIAKTGFISRKTIELNLSKAESIEVDQGIFGRIFNYGSLKINGTGSSYAPISGIDDPMEFRRQFMEAQDKALSK